MIRKTTSSRERDKNEIQRDRGQKEDREKEIAEECMSEEDSVCEVARTSSKDGKQKQHQ